MPGNRFLRLNSLWLRSHGYWMCRPLACILKRDPQTPGLQCLARTCRDEQRQGGPIRMPDIVDAGTLYTQKILNPDPSVPFRSLLGAKAVGGLMKQGAWDWSRSNAYGQNQ